MHEDRRCLVDISNLNLGSNIIGSANDKIQSLKNNINVSMAGNLTPGGAKA